MTDRFKRGSAPGRARSEDQRPGSFKKGHKKRGGRQRGTPNKFSAEYKKDILEAAYRIGEDANGKLGLVGYLRWVARRYPQVFCSMLGRELEFQELEIGLPQRERPTVEEFNEAVRVHIGLAGHDQTQMKPAEPWSAADRTGRQDRTRRQTEPAQAPSTRKHTKRKEGTQGASEPADPDLPWAWTGRDAPVGSLVHLGIVNPKEFCTLLQAALPRPTAWQRGLAARRAWEERQRAEKRRREEQESRVTS